jgi:acetolactate synthase-1/3 small subunit
MSRNILIELIVKNHAGVMSHITGLFSRRGFNLEGILCAKTGDGSRSRVYLLVRNDKQLEQIKKQLEKLYDVLSVKIIEKFDESVFDRLREYAGVYEN